MGCCGLAFAGKCARIIKKDTLSRRRDESILSVTDLVVGNMEGFKTSLEKRLTSYIVLRARIILILFEVYTKFLLC